jgi:hypothetical protein
LKKESLITEVITKEIKNDKVEVSQPSKVSTIVPEESKLEVSTVSKSQPRALQNKKKLKEVMVKLDDYLAEWEKDYFYSLLGFVNHHNVKTDRDFYIFSVELLVETKFKSEKGKFKNLAINNQLKRELDSVITLEHLQNVLTVYNKCVINKIIILQDTYEKLANVCLK